MKSWDLTSGSKKLELGLESLTTAGAEVEQYWNDEAYRKFQENYIAPLEPKVGMLLDAIQRLAEVLNSAERHCGIM
jgi:hypothetical protein